MRSIVVAAIVASCVALPLSAQTYNLQDGRFQAQFQMDTNQDGFADTYGAPAAWSSPGGILFGRDYSPDGLVEGLVKLIDNTQANGHWSLAYASVTKRLVSVQVGNPATGHFWGIITGILPGEGWVWIAAPNGILDYSLAGEGGSVSIIQAFDPQGRIPLRYFAQHSAKDTAELLKTDARGKIRLRALFPPSRQGIDRSKER